MLFVVGLNDNGDILLNQLDICSIGIVNFLILLEGHPQLQKMLGDIGLNPSKLWLVILGVSLLSCFENFLWDAFEEILGKAALSNLVLDPDVDLEQL